MAISISNTLANGSASTASSYVTASISPTARKLILLSVHNRNPVGSPNTPTVTGAGMTWTQVVTQASGSGAGTNSRVTIFRALTDSPGSGALTIDMAGQNQSLCEWSVNEVSGMNNTGTNGANAIVQSGGNNNNNNTSSMTITLSALALSANATFGAFGVTNAPATITAGSGYTQLSNTTDTNGVMQTQWQLGTDNTVDWTYTSALDEPVGCAVEIGAFISGGFFAFM